MNGIAGRCFGDHERVRRDALVLTHALRRRGRAGTSQWIEGSGALVGLSSRAGSEATVTFDDATGRAAVLDARVDNRKELLADLRLGEDQVRSDASLVLAAYDRWGERFAERMLGDFAGAIWDARESRLLLFCDTAGTRPLYFARLAGGGAAFSSEMSALLCLPSLSRAANDLAVVGMLMRHKSDESATPLRDVQLVRPGHVLIATAARADQSAYWVLDPARPCRFADDRSFAEALRSELGRAVAARMAGHQVVAATLSGGLDSSSVVALAASQLSSEASLQGLNAQFDDVPECDERGFARATATRWGLPTQIVRPSREGASPRDLAELLRILDHPRCLGSHFVIYPIATSAAAHGASLVMTGFDGDRVVSHGSGYLDDLALSGAYWELLEETRQRYLLRGEHRLPSVVRTAARAYLPLPVRRAFLRMRQTFRAGLERSPSTFLRTKWIRALHERERLPVPDRGARNAHYRNLVSPDRAWDMQLTDACGAEAGVAFAHPFYDRRVVELCLSLPAAQRARAGVGRYVLRNAMEGLLPDAVRLRPFKTSFDAVNHRLRLRLLRQNASLIADAVAALGNYADVDRLRRSLESVTLNQGTPTPELVRSLTRHAALGIWLRSAGEARQDARFRDLPPIPQGDRHADATR